MALLQVLARVDAFLSSCRPSWAAGVDGLFFPCPDTGFGDPGVAPAAIAFQNARIEHPGDAPGADLKSSSGFRCGNNGAIDDVRGVSVEEKIDALDAFRRIVSDRGRGDAAAFKLGCNPGLGRVFCHLDSFHEGFSE